MENSHLTIDPTTVQAVEEMVAKGLKQQDPQAAAREKAGKIAARLVKRQEWALIRDLLLDEINKTDLYHNMGQIRGQRPDVVGTNMIIQYSLRNSLVGILEQIEILVIGEVERQKGQKK